MSLAREDWSFFDNLSGQLAIGDPTDRDGRVFANAEKGSWVAMCIRDSDSDDIERLLVMRDYIAEGILGDHVRLDFDAGRRTEHIGTRSGLVFLMDRKLVWNLPDFLHIPESKMSRELLDKLGSPYAEGKDSERSFAESCMHVGRDAACGMPMVGGMGYGAAADMGVGGMRVEMVLNDVRDAVAFEVRRER